MTLPLRAADVAKWTGASFLQGRSEASFGGVSIDTRTLAPGELFVTIRGAQHDAHDYLGRALAAGAAGLLVESGRPLPEEIDPELPAMVVGDTTAALGALAAGHRAGFHGPVVAITGSNGKTTTKEMCAAILEVAAPTLKNPGNWNNQFGLPLTLLRRDAEHRSLVLELGMNHRGEIAALARIARPTVGVITTVGTAHIEHLGSQDEIAREKGDLVAALESNATAVLNADDPRAVAQAQRTAAPVLLFGLGADAQVRPEHAPTPTPEGFAFDLVAPEGRCAVRLRGLGETTLWNALAAAAAALAAGASLSNVAAGLEAYRPIGRRMEPIALGGGVTLVDDSYNANPQSLEAALRSLAKLKGAGRGVAVLGDMGELGATSADAHRAAGRLVAQLGIEFLFALGEHAETLCASAVEAGMDPQRAVVAGDHAEASARVRELCREEDWVLVKGSRAMGMEKVVASLASGRC